MDLYLEGRKTVECVKIDASLDKIRAVLEEAASSFVNTTVKLHEDLSDGTATIDIHSNYTPRLLDEFTVEKIARATPLYPRTILSSVMSDREAAAKGMLNGGFGAGLMFVLEHTEDFSVIEYDLDDMDRKNSFDSARAFGYQSLVLAAAAAGINLQYEPEPMMTMRDGLNAIKKAFGNWEKVPKEEWEQRAKERTRAAEEIKRKEKERRAILVKEAKEAIVAGFQRGEYETYNEARAALDYEPTIVAAAWRTGQAEIVKAYWQGHPVKRSHIEAEISQMKASLTSSKSREDGLREELASLTGLFKGRKRREITALIAKESAKQEDLQKKIDSLSATFDAVPA